MLFYALSTLLKFSALIQLRYTEPDVLRPFQIPVEKNLLMGRNISNSYIHLYYILHTNMSHHLLFNDLSIYSLCPKLLDCLH
jgi:hypothetical protein